MKNLFVCILVVLVSGCASQPPKPPAPPTYAALLSKAKETQASGDVQLTKSAFEDVTKVYPDEIEPWQQLAQMEFKASNYSSAIVYAKRAMEISPEDSLSNSIVSVSGLRLSARALGVLRRTNKLQGSLRSEATSLADVLRSNLGLDEVVPTEKAEAEKTEAKKVKKARKYKRKRTSAKKRKTKAATAQGNGSNDPFASLE